MSAIHLFIDHPEERQLLVLVGAAVHQAPTPAGDDAWEVPLTPGHPGRLVRRGADPSRYPQFPWVLRVGGVEAGGRRDDPLATVVRTVADDLRAGGCRTMVVHDLPDGDADAPAGTWEAEGASANGDGGDGRAVTGDLRGGEPAG